MRVRRMAVVALWIMSLVVASQWGSARAQSEQEPPAKAPGLAPLQVVSGADLGFMVLPGTGEQDTPAGVIVIRQRGQWVPVEISRPVSPGDSRGRVVPLR